MNNQKKIIHLVSGVSSVGKSSYIRAKQERGDWSITVPVIMAYHLESSDKNLKKEECIVHYNLLRPIMKNTSKINKENEFYNDVVICKIIELSEIIQAYVLLAPFSIIKERISFREIVEEPTLSKDGETTYPVKEISELIKEPSTLENIYEKWIQLLEEVNIEYYLIDTTDKRYKEIINKEMGYSILRK